LRHFSFSFTFKLNPLSFRASEPPSEPSPPPGIAIFHF
jgi:hypothetical protein